MPVSEEPLKEKIPFDVYAMMLILGFLATAGSIALVNDDLQKHWNAGRHPSIDQSEHLTGLNEVLEEPRKYFDYLGNPENKDLPLYIRVTQNDLRDYKILTAQEEVPKLTPEGYKEYPPEIDPKTKPVLLTPGSDNLKDRSPDFVSKLVDEYKDITAAPGEGAQPGAAPKDGGAAPPTPEAPKAEEPKADAPKADAPKADAPKADATKTDAPKADATKADAPKADATKADAPKAEGGATPAPGEGEKK